MTPEERAQADELVRLANRWERQEERRRRREERRKAKRLAAGGTWA